MKIRQVIDYEMTHQIAVVTIDNPPANSLTDDVLSGLDECLDMIEANSDIRAVILTGNGKFFIAGADIKEFSTWPFDELVSRTRRGQKILSRMETLSVPVIAAINGYALGGGLETALACDFRIASDRAKMGLPEATLGIVPAYGGITRLAQMIGEGEAKKLIYTAETLTAQRALELGIVQEVVPGDQLMARCIELAEKIAAVAPLSVRKVKEGLFRRRECGLLTSLENEVLFSMECYHTKDRAEGIDAFINKRTAVFTNQ